MGSDVSVDLSDIGVTLGLDLGSDPNRPLAVEIGGPMNTPLELLVGGPENLPVVVNLGLNLAAGGTGTPLVADLGLSNVVADLGLDNIVADLGLDNVNVAVGGTGTPLVVDLGLDNIKVDLGLDNINACLSLAIKEIPSVRVHLPAKSEFGFSLFGVSVFNFTFKGDTMLITEDNPPRMFLHPEETAPPSAYHSNFASSEVDSDVAYTVTLREEADET